MGACLLGQVTSDSSVLPIALSVSSFDCEVSGPAAALIVYCGAISCTIVSAEPTLLDVQACLTASAALVLAPRSTDVSAFT
jgi:hypothetical protein